MRKIVLILISIILINQSCYAITKEEKAKYITDCLSETTELIKNDKLLNAAVKIENALRCHPDRKTKAFLKGKLSVLYFNLLLDTRDNNFAYQSNENGWQSISLGNKDADVFYVTGATSLVLMNENNYREAYNFLLDINPDKAYELSKFYGAFVEHNADKIAQIRAERSQALNNISSALLQYWAFSKPVQTNCYWLGNQIHCNSY